MTNPSIKVRLVPWDDSRFVHEFERAREQAIDEGLTINGPKAAARVEQLLRSGAIRTRPWTSSEPSRRPPSTQLTGRSGARGRGIRPPTGRWSWLRDPTRLGGRARRTEGATCPGRASTTPKLPAKAGEAPQAPDR